MTEQDQSLENGTASPPERKKEIHIKIDIGKRFCIFVVALAALIAGVFVAVRFVPRGTPWACTARSSMRGCMTARTPCLS